MPAPEGISSQELTRLRSAIDEAAIVAITDAKGTITYVNKKFCAISEYSASELIGNTHRIINSGFHSKDFFVDMWGTINSGKTWEGEIRNRAKRGSHYWVHTTIVPFLDEQGRPEQYVSVRYDISERKAIQESLDIYAKKLEISNQELQDFASVAAHDLQEPLRKIQSFADRLQVKAGPLLAGDAKDYLDRILSSTKRMQTLINDLLTYSRVATRAQPFTAVDLGDVMSHVMSDLELRTEQLRGQVTWTDLPAIDADATQMRQLFQNLVSNALKFHKADLPPVVVVTAKLLPSLAARQDSVEIRISDNGIGFDEKYLGRIFTIFQRLHGRLEYEGTGIGLAVCRKIVERHGGSLTANSTLGQGATFVVTLPRKQSREAETDESK